MAPSDHDEVEKDKYYQKLPDLVSQIPCHDITIVMVDINAQIGGHRSGFEQFLDQHIYGKCTYNSNYFVSFCVMNNLKIGLSIIKQKDIYKITYISKNHKTATQIDHLAVGIIWRTSCLQVIRVHCGANICSDHRLVIAKIKIKLKTQEGQSSDQVIQHK